MSTTETNKSYSEQFDTLKGCKDLEVLNTALPKPSQEAQAKVPGAIRTPFSDVYTTCKQRPLLQAEPATIPWKLANIKNRVTIAMRCLVIVGMHLIALLYVPSTFTWKNLLTSWCLYVVYGVFGITFTYHRMLTHRSFKTSKWFEYLCAWLGSQAGQGDPIEWVSQRRLGLHGWDYSS